MGSEHISVGKPVKGFKNKTPHEPRVGLGLSNAEMLAAWEKKQNESSASKSLDKPKVEKLTKQKKMIRG